MCRIQSIGGLLRLHIVCNLSENIERLYIIYYVRKWLYQQLCVVAAVICAEKYPPGYPGRAVVPGGYVGAVVPVGYG